MMAAAPRGFIVAAPRSGSGKTTVTLGLMRALQRRGLKVAGFKCGPDYIDPAFHRAATGRDSLNLDSWAMPPQTIAAHLAEVGAGADIVVGEGLMGLHDGVPGADGRTGSTADIAAATGLPVLLVIDVSGQSQTAGAVAYGLARFDARIETLGVILNRVGSERHIRLATSAVLRAGLVPFGSLPREASLVIPERHLGLVQAEETAGLDALIDQMADFVETHVDMAGLVERVMGAPVASPPPTLSLPLKGGGDDTGTALPFKSPPPVRGRDRVGGSHEHSDTSALSPNLLPPPGQRIALARDAAFSFIYPHIVLGWRRAGAEIVPFSPLADDAPPEDCDACWLPGGYPELHGATLAAADRFREGLARFALTRPVHGECGGYMVLGQALVDAHGNAHAMAGLLCHVTSFEKRRMNLGYRTATLAAGGIFGPAGTELKGHEFHYSVMTEAGTDMAFASVTDAHGGGAKPAGGQRGHVSGSYFHVIARG